MCAKTFIHEIAVSKSPSKTLQRNIGTYIIVLGTVANLKNNSLENELFKLFLTDSMID